MAFRNQIANKLPSKQLHCKMTLTHTIKIIIGYANAIFRLINIYIFDKKITHNIIAIYMNMIWLFWLYIMFYLKIYIFYSK